MKVADLKKKLRLVERLTGMEISKESLETVIKNFKDKAEEEFLAYVPMFIHEANVARKLLKYKEKEEKSKLILSEDEFKFLLFTR